MRVLQAMRRRLDLVKQLVVPPSGRFYSQCGEDRILKSLFPGPTGFYVDVGAYDPRHFSNTAHFYGIGWAGINVEPSPVRFTRFPVERPRDINLNVGVAEASGTLNFYRMEPDTLSTFSEATARSYSAFEHHRVAEVIPVPVLRLRDIFEKHAPNRAIDFLSVDTEGLEKEVLGSNDWTRFRPVSLLIEYREYHPNGSTGTSAAQWEPLLLKHGYRLAYLNFLNALYVREEDKALLGKLSGEGTGYSTIESALPHIKPL